MLSLILIASCESYKSQLLRFCNIVKKSKCTYSLSFSSAKLLGKCEYSYSLKLVSTPNASHSSSNHSYK